MSRRWSRTARGAPAPGRAPWPAVVGRQRSRRSVGRVTRSDRPAGRRARSSPPPRPRPARRRPARGARSSFCIFIASTTRSVWPASTASPAATATAATRPGIMARTSTGPLAARASRARVARRPKVGPGGVLDLELEPPAVDDDLDDRRPSGPALGPGRPSRRRPGRPRTVGTVVADRVDRRRRLVAGHDGSAVAGMTRARSARRGCRWLIAATGRRRRSRAVACPADAGSLRRSPRRRRCGRAPGAEPRLAAAASAATSSARARSALDDAASHSSATQSVDSVAGAEPVVARPRTGGTAASSGCR